MSDQRLEERRGQAAAIIAARLRAPEAWAMAIVGILTARELDAIEDLADVDAGRLAIACILDSARIRARGVELVEALDAFAEAIDDQAKPGEGEIDPAGAHAFAVGEGESVEVIGPRRPEGQQKPQGRGEIVRRLGG